VKSFQTANWGKELKRGWYLFFINCKLLTHSQLELWIYTEALLSYLYFLYHPWDDLIQK
jgi:hypothetical protein